MFWNCIARAGLTGLMFVALSAGETSVAAELTVTSAQDGGSIITLIGPIEQGDSARFLTAIIGVGRATISLNSDGGNAYASIEIGRIIRLRGYSTAVFDGRRCASACALVWLGGVSRYMGATASVGFHSAYTVEAGQLLTSGAGNALVGAYLSQLGLSDRAVILLTQAQPTQMIWLTRDQALRNGIDVMPLPPTKPVIMASPEPQRIVRPAGLASPQQLQPPATIPRGAPEVTPFVQPVGPRHTFSFSLRGRRIPLPPGEWVEIGRHAWLGGTPGPTFTYEDVALAAVQKIGVTALIIIRTSDYDGGVFVRTWGANTVCSTTGTYAAEIRNYNERRHECTLLNYAVSTSDNRSSEVWKKYMALKSQDINHYPSTFISASYRFAQGVSATTVTYYFGIEQFGFPVENETWAAGSWRPSNLSPEQASLVARYRIWQKTNFEAVQQGAEQNRVTALTVPPLP